MHRRCRVQLHVVTWCWSVRAPVYQPTARFVDGACDVNESMVTGESRPVTKNPGPRVIAGTVNDRRQRSRVRVTETGDEPLSPASCAWSRRRRRSKSRAQALADRAAFWLTMVALAAAYITLVVWIVAGRRRGFAVERLVTVLVIACPHALGLAIPLVDRDLDNALGRGTACWCATATALEEARVDLDIVVFDKTGTLTRGEHGSWLQRHGRRRRWSEALGPRGGGRGRLRAPAARAFVARRPRRRLSVSARRRVRVAPRVVAFRRVVDGRVVAVGGPACSTRSARSCRRTIGRAHGDGAAAARASSSA